MLKLSPRTAIEIASDTASIVQRMVEKAERLANKASDRIALDYPNAESLISEITELRDKNGLVLR